MPNRQRMGLALLVLSLIALATGTAFARSPHGRGGTQQCPLDCGVKLEHGPWVYSGEKVIVAVCIKAGQEHISFVGDGTDHCYTVTGLGTMDVTVTGGGTGRYCKDISNVVFYFDCDGGGGGGGLPG